MDTMITFLAVMLLFNVQIQGIEAGADPTVPTTMPTPDPTDPPDPTTPTTMAPTVAPTMARTTTVSSTFCNVDLAATTTSQTFTSPNHPSNYASNMNCFVRLTTALADHAIQITPTAMTMESTTYCNADYVAVYDGYNTSSSLIGQYCGTTIPATITSSSLRMYILMVSDFSFNYQGVSINYIAIDNSYPNCKASFTALTADSNVRTFSSSGTTYSSNADEYFVIDSSGTGALILNLISMSVENAYNCIYDRIIIYDGGCTRYTVLHTHCGRRLVRWELSGNEYLVHFHSDGSVQQAGFTMEYYLGTSGTGAPTTTTTTIGPPLASEVSLVGEVLTNYSTENMPQKDLSIALASTVDVYFVGINGLDEVSQKLTSTMQFIIKWSDDFLAWPPTKKAGITQILIPQDDIWKPDFALLNGFERITQMGASFMFVVVNATGSCEWKPYQILESVCPVDMSNYPYDTQVCELKFSTWSSSSDQVTTTIGGNGISKHERFVENGEWTLISITQRSDTVNGKPTEVFTITMKRNHAFTVFYIAIPVVMLSFLCVFTFALPLASGEKSGFGITVFLSFVVYVIVAFQKMPENSESISLFGVFVLFMTCVSGFGVMIVTLETRMLTLSTRNKPIPQCTKSVTKRVLLLQKKLLCMGPNTIVQEADVPTDDSVTWPDFVSALDFICFFVYLIIVTIATFFFMIYLSVQ